MKSHKIHQRTYALAALALIATAALPSAFAQTKNYGRKAIKCEQSQSKVAVTLVRQNGDRVGQELILRSGWRAKITHANAVTNTIAIISSPSARCANDSPIAAPNPERACRMDMDCGPGSRCMPLPGTSAAGDGGSACTSNAAAQPAAAKYTSPKHRNAGCQALIDEHEAKGWQVYVMGGKDAAQCAKNPKKQSLKSGDVTGGHAKVKITDCKLIACPR